MILFTLADCIRDQAGDGNALVTRPAIGVRRFDLCLLVPQGLAETRTGGVAARLRAEGLRVATIALPGPEGPPPDSAPVDDCRLALVLCIEGQPCDGPWLWWMLGRASVTARKQALLPVSRRDLARPLTSFRPRIPSLLTGLPWVGWALAVGDAQPSLWVAPAGSRAETREAVNLEFWINERG